MHKKQLVQDRGYEKNGWAIKKQLKCGQTSGKHSDFDYCPRDEEISHQQIEEFFFKK